jgi:hypothetical protein
LDGIGSYEKMTSLFEEAAAHPKPSGRSILAPGDAAAFEGTVTGQRLESVARQTDARRCAESPDERRLCVNAIVIDH